MEEPHNKTTEETVQWPLRLSERSSHNMAEKLPPPPTWCNIICQGRCQLLEVPAKCRVKVALRHTYVVLRIAYNDDGIHMRAGKPREKSILSHTCCLEHGYKGTKIHKYTAYWLWILCKLWIKQGLSLPFLGTVCLVWLAKGQQYTVVWWDVMWKKQPLL